MKLLLILLLLCSCSTAPLDKDASEADQKHNQYPDPYGSGR